MIINLCVYLMVLAFSVLSALFLNSSIGYTPLFMILALTAVSAVYTFISYLSVGYIERGNREIFIRKNPAKLKIDLVNNSPMFIPHISLRIFCGDEIKNEEFSLFAHKTRSIETDMSFRHVGLYSIGIKHVRFFGLLDVFSLSRGHRLRKVVVAPRVVDIGSITLWRENSRVNSLLPEYSKLHEDEAYNGVREYIPGDSLKSIHWKLTAHTTKYMSRKYEANNKNGLTVFLDLFPPGYGTEADLSALDCIEETAISAAVYGLNLGFDTELVYCRDDFVESCTIAGLSDVSRVLPMLSKLSFNAGAGLSRMIKECLESGSCHENIVVCTANINKELVSLFGELAGLHINPVLFGAVSADFNPAAIKELIRYLNDRGIEFRFIKDSDELETDTVSRQTV